MNLGLTPEQIAALFGGLGSLIGSATGSFAAIAALSKRVEHLEKDVGAIKTLLFSPPEVPHA